MATLNYSCKKSFWLSVSTFLLKWATFTSSAKEKVSIFKISKDRALLFQTWKAAQCVLKIPICRLSSKKSFFFSFPTSLPRFILLKSDIRRSLFWHFSLKVIQRRKKKVDFFTGLRRKINSVCGWIGINFQTEEKKMQFL